MSWHEGKQRLVNSIVVALDPKSETIHSVCNADIKIGNDSGSNYHELMKLFERFDILVTGPWVILRGGLAGCFRVWWLKNIIRSSANRMSSELGQHFRDYKDIRNYLRN
jgi:hypothetical protein